MDGGRIIFYDFGMMDELTVPLKRSFSDLIFGIYGNDLKEVVDSLEEMDVIRKVSWYENILKREDSYVGGGGGGSGSHARQC